MSHSISAKSHRLHQRSRSRRRKSMGRKSTTLSRRRISAPESLECRTLLAGDVFAAADLPNEGDTPDDIGPPNPGQIFVSGTKWEDFNANGFRDRGEPGLGGVTIYSDLNRDGQLSEGEPHTTTQDDGQYFLDLEPGQHAIAEVVPDGFEQTYPRSGGPRIEFADLDDEFATVEPRLIHFDGPSREEFSITVHPTCIRPYELTLESNDAGLFFLPTTPEPILNGCGGDTSTFEILLLNAPAGESSIDIVDQLDGSVLGSVTVSAFGSDEGGHFVFGEIGEETFVEGIDFGNHRDVPGATVSGRKWQDQNKNGVQDGDEAGLGGVTIFADVNGNGYQDRNEPSTTTSFDDPVTDFDESGFYSFEDLDPGSYVIREVVPAGFEQTFPSRDFDLHLTDEGRYADGQALEMVLDGVSNAGSDLTLDFSVLWNNGCGMLDAETSVGTVVGSNVAVELHGYQTGTICTEALEWQSVSVDIEGGLPSSRGIPEFDFPDFFPVPGFQVFTTLRESFIDFETGEPTDEVATLVSVNRVHMSELRGHSIEVGPEDTVDGLDFGNYRLPPGMATGTKWNDINGNGVRDDEEPGLAGVTIYSDANGNGVLDEGESFTVTLADDPATDVDETGTFVLSDLAVGPHWIKEIVPDGFVQTFPWGFGFPDIPFPIINPAIDPVIDPEWIFQEPEWDPCGLEDCVFVEPPLFFEGGGWHDIWVESGSVHEGLDFGNQEVKPGSIHGTKWFDANGNGWRDEGENGLAGVTIYIDANSNGEFDSDELSAVTMSDDPDTGVDETGMYWLEGVEGNQQYVVREVVPDGYVQTAPGALWDWCGPTEDCAYPLLFGWGDDAHYVWVGNGQTVESIDFGNAENKPGSVSGTKWFDANGNGWRDEDEIGLAGVTIYVDANNNGQFDEGELSAVTIGDDSDTEVDETGQYVIDGLEQGHHEVREVVPEGYVQTFPGYLPRPIPFEDFPAPVIWPIDPLPPLADGAHVVFVRIGATVNGVDFGNQENVPAQVHGTKWHDINGNGWRDEGEPGIAGVTIYADIDFDGQFSADFEPSTVTMADDPTTDVDEAGNYRLEGLDPGQYVIREIVPDGYVQTFPYGFVIPFEPIDLPPGEPIEPGFGGPWPVDVPPIDGPWLPVEPDFPIGGPGDPWWPVDVPPIDEPIEPIDDLPWFPGEPWIPEPEPWPDPFFPIPYPDSEGGHHVYLGVGSVVEGIDFGNREEGPVGIEGRKWQDNNGNGWQDRNEPGLAGVTIYIDANNNHQFDDGEISTVTSEDDPDTVFDETGYYVFNDVEPGQYYVREVIPEGYEQTFPREFPDKVIVEPGYGEPIDPIVTNVFHLIGDPEIGPITNQTLEFLVNGGCGELIFADTTVQVGDNVILVDITVDSTGHEVACDADSVEVIHSVEIGDLAGGEYLIQANLLETDSDGTLRESFYIETFLFVEESFSRVAYVSETHGALGVDFGNRPIQVADKTIEGRKWQDDNGNGVWDREEVGLGGVTIYLDANNNERFDRGEVATVTEFDIPETDFDEAGLYHFAVPAGEYVVREIVPDGFEQTFPNTGKGITILESAFVPPVTTVVTGIQEFSLSQPIHNGEGTSELTFIVTTPGCGSGLEFDLTETEHNDGKIDIHVRMRADIPFEPACLGAPVTEMQTLDFGYLEAGTYGLRASIQANQFPAGNPGNNTLVDGGFIEATIEVGASSAHRVFFGEGDVALAELNFGNKPVEASTGSIVGNVRIEGLDADEPGFFEVFLDTNLNGQYDADDLVTNVIPNFEIGIDDVGYFYEFGDLEPDFYVVRMVPSDEYEVVFPTADITCRALYCTPDMQTVNLESGQVAERSFAIQLNDAPAPDRPALAVFEGDTEDVSHDWDDPSNWVVDGKLDALPSESSSMGDDVVFGADGGLIELGSNESRMVHSLHFNSGDYDLSGENTTFDVTSGQLFVGDSAKAQINAYLHSSDGTVTKTGDGILLVNGGADRIVVTGGTLGGGPDRIGQLELAGGRLAPGASIGSMNSTTLIMDPNSTFEVELGANGRHDVMTSHVAFLNGELDVQLLDGAMFGERGSTQTISVLRATGAVQGKFDTVSSRHLGDGVFYDLSYDSQNVNLDVLTALPGDANGDGSVDATDLGVWQSNRFKIGSWTDGDFSGDGLVDGTDFNLWQQHSFDRVLDSPNQGGVPRAALAARAVAVPDLQAADQAAIDGLVGRTAAIDRTITFATPNADNTDRLGRRTADRTARRVRGEVSQSAESQPAWTNLVDNLFADLDDMQ